MNNNPKKVAIFGASGFDVEAVMIIEKINQSIFQ